MTAARKRCRGGYTLLEVVIVGALLAVVGGKVFMLLGQFNAYTRQESSNLALQDAAERVLDRIAYSLMGADRDTLIPTQEAPFHSGSIRYQYSMGMEDDTVIWSDPERIGFDPGQANELVWFENPDSPDERRVVWTKLLQPLLEGEVANGLDDNGNGLVDETGISFDIVGGSVLVRMTLGRADGQTVTLERTVEATVTCRNYLDQRNGIERRR